MDKKAERLAKRRERRRQRLAKETAEERETRLGKRREAWEKKTAEAKGKQRQNNRIYRQQKEAAESTEEREARLAKQREAWGKKTAEAKGKKNENMRVYREQKHAGESAEERETRLAKGREASEKKTAEVKGKTNEYMRVYRQQKQAGESAEEIETRLAKRREAWQERTPEVKGKRKEYKRVYNLDKMQNETEEERTNRKQDQETETVDERARILEILRAVFYTASANENDQESHEQLSMSVDPTVDISVPEADEDSEFVHEAEGPEVSRNEYLHEGGWQNVDNPLHELEFVQNEMHSFHLDQEHLEHRQCTMCKEAWPTRQNLASEVYICYRCKRDKKSPKKFSAENDMDPGIVPEQLRGLTRVEEMLISRVCPIMRVYRKHGGQRGYKGHVLNLPQDIQSFLNRLPSRVADLPVLIVRRHGAEDTHRDFTVRRHKVLEAVLWLKTNNPFFKDIEIDRDVIQSLPENGIPDELRYVIDENELSVHVENEGPPQDPVMSANASVEELVLGSGSTSFIPMHQRQRKQGAAIQDAVNEVDPLDWPSTEGNLVNEFKTDGLATMAFPTLFPYGKGDPTNRARQHGITLTEAFKHLMKFAERLADGKFECSHPRFPYWALNMKQRHQLLSQANVYLRQHPADANMTMEELKQMVNSMSANQMVNRLQRYVSKVQGTNQYWYQRLQELLALIEQKGCPTFFFTFSAADMHWPDLQRLLQNDEGASRSERGRPQ